MFNPLEIELGPNFRSPQIPERLPVAFRKSGTEARYRKRLHIEQDLVSTSFVNDPIARELGTGGDLFMLG